MAYVPALILFRRSDLKKIALGLKHCEYETLTNLILRPRGSFRRCHDTEAPVNWSSLCKVADFGVFQKISWM